MVLRAGDTISGQEGTAYIEIDGRNEVMFYLKDIEAIVEKEKIQLRTLGKRGDQNKAVGWSGTGSMSIYKTTTKFAEMAQDYVKNGIDHYFNITVTNDDPSSTVGAQRVVLKDVNLDSYNLVNLNVESEALEDEMDFTFDDFDVLESFNKPSNF